MILVITMMIMSAAATSIQPNTHYMKKCAYGHPFCNASLTAMDRSKNLVSLLTLKEKIAQLSTNSFTKTYSGYVPGIPRLGVPEYNYHTEGLHGVRDTYVAGFENSTLFPQVTGMAATGNLTLIRAMGYTMALEMRAVNNAMRKQNIIVSRGGGLALYGPTINIIRDGRWGRNQETVSEDPWLSGQYAVNFIQGVQGHDTASDYLATAATCKHLDAYSQETNRHNSNAEVTTLDMMETYLPQFEACINAGATQVMCSYNKINGVPACLSGDIQNRIVRDKWHFEGSIVSDCDAIKDVNVTQKTMTGPEVTAAGILNGCDQDCGNFYGLYAEEALGKNIYGLNVTNIDVALQRIFLMRFQLGEFGDMSIWNTVSSDVVGSTEHIELSMQAARESITLLRNDHGIVDNETVPVLPLQQGRTVALVGPLANDADVMEGSKHDYNAAHLYSVKEGMEHVMVNSSALLTYRKGLQNVTDIDIDSDLYKSAVRAAIEADIAVVVIGIDGSIEAEAKDRQNVVLPGAQEQFVKDIANGRTTREKKLMVIVFINGGPISCDYLKELTPVPIAVVEAFEGGQGGGIALAEILYGIHNPSGVLPYTLYSERATTEDIVPFNRFDMRPDVSVKYPGRTYRFSVAPVLFEFGFGLSYTTFQLEWSSATLPIMYDVQRVHSPGVQHVVKVTNTGSVAGAKVVHAFVTKEWSTLHQSFHAPTPPIKALYGMEKVWLEPGETKELIFNTASMPGSKPFTTTLHDGTSMMVPGKVRIQIGVQKEEKIELECVMTGVAFQV